MVPLTVPHSIVPPTVGKDSIDCATGGATADLFEDEIVSSIIPLVAALYIAPIVTENSLLGACMMMPWIEERKK